MSKADAAKWLKSKGLTGVFYDPRYGKEIKHFSMQTGSSLAHTIYWKPGAGSIEFMAEGSSWKECVEEIKSQLGALNPPPKCHECGMPQGDMDALFATCLNPHCNDSMDVLDYWHESNKRLFRPLPEGAAS